MATKSLKEKWLSMVQSAREKGENGIGGSPTVTIIDNEEEYEVEAILSHKGPNAHRLYLTAWKGYPSSENTWEPEINLHHSPTLLKHYQLEHRLR